MKKTLIYAIVGAVGVTTFAETTPQAFAASAKSAPASLEQVRANVRSEAMTALGAGQVENVGRRGRGYYGGRRHYGGRGYYGGRRYYGGRGYYGGRRYYGARRYYGGRRRPAFYFGFY